MKIYFVRHGKTQWNLEKRLQGQKGDSPLLPESYEAIARVNERLGQIVQFDKVISSPQPRAVTTAKLLTTLPVKTDNRLSEWNFGQLEGQLVANALLKYPDEMFASRNELQNFDGRHFGAETVAHVLTRFDSLASDLKKQEAENILLVGHGASGTAGMRHLAGFPLQELRTAGGLANNSVTVLETKGQRFEMLHWNKVL
ncbi:histidine phosphatase family protein [Lactococcus garvieae]|uniref:histidine phosphatase family protein n=1 Tax=Lactococcus garvieae TaxID=1363 RepID=UPI0028924BF1|nr:histidine phosphatase family protein [Lactococcus garvieae]MDT2741093.1 histidine phosphatase family protein [Lactococcus garvieae]